MCAVCVVFGFWFIDSIWVFAFRVGFWTASELSFILVCVVLICCLRALWGGIIPVWGGFVIWAAGVR